jgi:hypothetical protein
MERWEELNKHTILMFLAVILVIAAVMGSAKKAPTHYDQSFHLDLFDIDYTTDTERK